MQFTDVRFAHEEFQQWFTLRVPEIASTTALARLADNICNLPPEIYEMCRPFLPNFEARALWALLMVRRGRLDELRHFITASPELRLHPGLVNDIFAHQAFALDVMTPPNLGPRNSVLTYDDLVRAALLARNLAKAREHAAERRQALEKHRAPIMLHGTAFRLALDRPSANLNLSTYTAQPVDQWTTWSDLIGEAVSGGRAGEARELERLRAAQDDSTLWRQWSAILEVVAEAL